MVHRLLTDLDMIHTNAHVLVNTEVSPDLIRVALYDEVGTGAKGPPNIEEDLAVLSNVIICRVGVPEIRAGVLDQFDVLVVPGGSASKQAAALGTDGTRAVVKFVADGGGYVGFCAGAYLACNNYAWSLKILDARVIDRQHWKRGTGEVEIELTAQGCRLLLDKTGNFGIRYANGPLLAPDEDPNIPDFQTLAYFRTEIRKNDAPPGVMKDTPAIVIGRFHKGRVFCSSPHPESTDGLDAIVRRAILWAAPERFYNNP